MSTSELTGIDPELFNNTEFHGKTKGLISGKKLSVDISPDRINISDFEDDDFMFEAKVANGTVSITVKTRGYRNIPEARHPDLFAKKLIQSALSYFERNGVQIRQWKAVWRKNGELSDNYFQFEDNIINKKMSPEDSARAIWSGQVSEGLGFKQVSQVLYLPNLGECVVFFTKQ